MPGTHALADGDAVGDALLDWDAVGATDADVLADREDAGVNDALRDGDGDGDRVDDALRDGDCDRVDDALRDGDRVDDALRDGDCDRVVDATRDGDGVTVALARTDALPDGVGDTVAAGLGDDWLRTSAEKSTRGASARTTRLTPRMTNAARCARVESEGTPECAHLAKVSCTF